MSGDVHGDNPAYRDLKFDQVTAVNRQRAERWHPGFPDGDGDEWTLADWSNAMCGEAGEAANVVKKIRRHECGLRGQLDPPLLDLTGLTYDTWRGVRLAVEAQRGPWQ